MRTGSGSGRLKDAMLAGCGPYEGEIGVESSCDPRRGAPPLRIGGHLSQTECEIARFQVRNDRWKKPVNQGFYGGDGGI